MTDVNSPADVPTDDKVETQRRPKRPNEKHVEVSIVDAVFLRSDPGLLTMPPISPEAPEVAFMGKSNVGKSSLLNAMMLRKALVKTSKTPGHTRLMNQFGVTVQLRRTARHLTLVDLPGYGFAKMPKGQQIDLSRMLGDYLSNREGLSALVHLFDMRHEPTKQDITTWQQLSVLTRTRIVVGTKSDRVPPTKRRTHAKMIASALGIHADDVVVFSAESREGRSALWGRILAATGQSVPLDVSDLEGAADADVVANAADIAGFASDDD